MNNPENPVAPGLEVPAVLEYCTSNPQVEKDRLVVTVDDDVVEVPVIAYVYTFLLLCVHTLTLSRYICLKKYCGGLVPCELFQIYPLPVLRSDLDDTIIGVGCCSLASTFQTKYTSPLFNE